MPRFDHAIIVSFDAPTYEDSLREAKYLSNGLADEGEIVQTPIYAYDNEGQRVLYLHPENESADAPV